MVLRGGAVGACRVEVRVDSDLSWDAKYPVIVARSGEARAAIVAPLSDYTFGGPGYPALLAALRAFASAERIGVGVELVLASRVTGVWAASRSRITASEALLLEPLAPRGVVRVVPPTPPMQWGLAARAYLAAVVASKLWGVRVEVGGLCESWDKYVLESRGRPATCILFHPSQWRVAAAIAAASLAVDAPREPLVYRFTSELVAERLSEGRLEDARRAGYLIPLMLGVEPLTSEPSPPREWRAIGDYRARAAVLPSPHWAPRARKRPEPLVEAWRASRASLAGGAEGVAVRGLLLSLLWRGYSPAEALTIASAIARPLGGRELEALEALGAVEAG